MSISEDSAGVSTAELELRLGAYGEYGELFIQDSDGYSKSIPATDWTIIDDMNDGIFGGSVALDGATGKMTFNKKGVYRGIFSTSFGLNNGAVVRGGVFINGVLSDKSEFTRTIANPNDFGAATITSMSDIVVGVLPVVVEFKVFFDTARTISIENMNINIAGIS